MLWTYCSICREEPVFKSKDKLKHVKKNIHTYKNILKTIFIKGQLPKSQFLHPFTTPLWIPFSLVGVLSVHWADPAAVSSQCRMLWQTFASVSLKRAWLFSLDGDVWRAPLIPPCLMMTPLNPTNSVSPFVRDGIHKPFFEGSIFQEHVHSFSVAFIWPGLGIPFWSDGWVSRPSGLYQVLEWFMMVTDFGKIWNN